MSLDSGNIEFKGWSGETIIQPYTEITFVKCIPLSEYDQLVKKIQDLSEEIDRLNKIIDWYHGFDTFLAAHGLIEWSFEGE